VQRRIRNNVNNTFITPVLEVDGRERAVDSYYYSKKNPGAQRQSLMMYRGKYVQHDNNRDGMGSHLKTDSGISPREFLSGTPPYQK